MKNPHIKYPRQWEFKIIGTDEQSLRKAISELLGNKEHKISFSKESSGGKYISLNLEMHVASEDDRNKIFTSLGNHSEIKMVI